MAKDLDGKQFLVTGATEGLGKAAAMAFAERGAAQVLVARSREKGERVIAEIRAGSGNDRLELLVGDLSSQADVRRVAAEFKAKHDRLDVLVNNAGAFFLDHALTGDGIERTFAVNHVAYFLLTTEVLGLLRQTPGARVVNTASGAHRIGKLKLDFVVKRAGKAGFPAYGDSKLANILFTKELARRLQATGGVANCLHPGWVATGLALNNGGLGAKVTKAAAAMFARTPAKGAETLVWLATAPEAGRISGEYCYDCKPVGCSRLARDEALARELWAFSEKLCAAA